MSEECVWIGTRILQVSISNRHWNAENLQKNKPLYQVRVIKILASDSAIDIYSFIYGLMFFDLIIWLIVKTM